MDRYRVIKEVGDGTFGNVWRAVHYQSGEIVAIKKMKKKYYSWEECINLREVKSLQKMNHPNIIKLKEIIREQDTLYFVFEYMECNLYQLIENRCKLFLETEVRNWCFQVFHALAYMHRSGYFHRDLKPENLLVTKDIIKIADFGLAREVHSDPPFTDYVSTRWYRAPEILLQSSVYDSGVGKELAGVHCFSFFSFYLEKANFDFSCFFPVSDLWAMGAIMAELLTLRPLFPGSSEVDEIYKICSVLGSPNSQTWPEGLKLAAAINYKFPEFGSVHLSTIIPSASDPAISLISSLCSWDPRKRPTAAEALRHTFFQACHYIPPALRMKATVLSTPSSEVIGSTKQNGVKKFAGSLSNSKVANAGSAWKNNSYTTNVRRRLEMNHHYQIANNQAMFDKSCDQQQSRYRLPFKNDSDDWTKKCSTEVAFAAEKMSNLTINPGSPKPLQSPLSSLPMKGRRHERHSDNLCRPHEYSRKGMGG